MGLTRPGDTPQFFHYPISYALVSSDITAEDWDVSVKEMDPNPIRIPPYQRKIVWKEQQVKEFLDSTAVLYGTVILASEAPGSLILLDGLQRFATGTAIINQLYPLVLDPNPSDPSIADKFKLLKAHVASFQPIFNHNDNMLRNHSRKGIASSYETLSKAVANVIKEELNEDPDKFAEKIKKTFVNKQIAIDTYHGFKNPSELTHTFININSTGMELTEVDLLRSEIIQQADAKNWSEDDIEDVENNFTEIFQSGKIKGAKVLGKNLYDTWVVSASKVFQNWDSLEKSQVDDLLNFIESMAKAAKDKDSNPYLYEIYECGDLPIAITVWFFYKYAHLAGNDPDFLGGTNDTNANLHLLLRSFYRKILDGSIGRIGPIVSSFFQEKPKTLDNIPALASKINSDSGSGTLDVVPDEGWAIQSLRKAGGNRSRRIFNACLLPDRKQAGDNFDPLSYGTKKLDWNLDHLIPISYRKKNEAGDDEMDQIINLSPLPSDLNIRAKTLRCSQKIKPGDLYSSIPGKHPYVDWLCSEHYKEYETTSDSLDLQSCMVLNSDPHIGDRRIQKIYDLIKDKL